MRIFFSADWKSRHRKKNCLYYRNQQLKRMTVILMKLCIFMYPPFSHSSGFTIVLRCAKGQSPVGQGVHLPAKYKNLRGILLMWYNFKFEGVLFRSHSRHNDRVDSLWECATKQAVMTGIETKLLGGLWLLAKQMFKMDSCLRGANLNLTAFCSIWMFIEECGNNFQMFDGH